jgi:hypothetical protein
MRIPDHPHFDATENYHFARQLEAVRAKVLEVQYGPLKAADAIPMKTDIDPGAEAYTYRVDDEVGAAALVADMADDGPTVDVKGSEVTSKIRSAKDKYIYTVQDVRNSRMSGRDLPMGKARAARNAIARLIDNVMLLGDGSLAYLGLRGLYNLASTNTYALATGAAGATTFASKTADEILADLHGVCDEITVDTKELFDATDLHMPLVEYQRISRMRIGPDTSETVLTHFLKTRADMKKPVTVTATAKQSTKLVAFCKNPDVLEGILPIAFEQFAPQYAGSKIITECHGRTGGVVAYHTLAICYSTGTL